MCYASGLLHPLQRVRAWWQRDLRILAYHRVMPLPDPDTYEFDLNSSARRLTIFANRCCG